MPAELVAAVLLPGVQVAAAELEQLEATVLQLQAAPGAWEQYFLSLVPTMAVVEVVV